MKSRYKNQSCRRLYSRCLPKEAREWVPCDCLSDYMLCNYTALLLIQKLTFRKYLRLTDDCCAYKVVTTDERKCAQPGRNLRSARNSDVHVIRIPILTRQSLVYRGVDGVVIGRNLVEVLGR